MSDDNITFLSEKANNNKFSSIKQVLENVIKDIDSGELDANKLIVLFLKEEDSVYEHGFYMANMRFSDAVALLEAEKTCMIGELNGHNVYS